MVLLLLWACLFQVHTLPSNAQEPTSHPELAFRFRNGGTLAYSPDGKIVATGGQDKTIQLWDSHNGELLRTLPLPELAAFLAFSPDGSTLVCRSATSDWDEYGYPSHHVLLWDVASGKLLKQWGEEKDEDSHRYRIWTVAYSPDGKILALGATSEEVTNNNGKVYLLDAHTGALLRRLTVTDGYTGTLAFSPDSSTLAGMYADPRNQKEREIRLWDVQSGELRHTLSGHGMEIGSLDFSPDGKILAADCSKQNWNSPGYIQLWDVQTGEEQRKLAWNDTAVSGFAFAPDGKTMASKHLDLHTFPNHWTSLSGDIVLWDLAAGKQTHVLPGHGFLYAMTYSPDGSTLATTDKNIVSLWNPQTGALLHKTVFADEQNLSTLLYASDGKTLLCSGSSTRWLNAHDLKTRTVIDGGYGRLAPIASSREGSLQVSAGQNELALLNLRIGRTEQQLPRIGAGLGTSIAFSPDNKTLATRTSVAITMQGELQLWDLQTGRPKYKIEEERKASRKATRSEGQKVVSPAHWNTMVFSPDGATVILGGVAADDGSAPRARTAGVFGSSREERRAGLAWWDVRSGVLRRTSAVDTDEVFAIAISPKGDLLATSSLSETVLWDAGADKQIWKKRTLFPGGAPAEVWRAGRIRALAFSPDGQTLASADTSKVRLWDVATGNEIATMEGHSQPISAVAFSPDGSLLASAGEEGTVRLWDMSTHTTRKVLTHDSAVTTITFSPDGRVLISGSRSGKSRLWNIETGKLLLTREVFLRHGDHAPLTWIAYTPEGYYDGSPDIKDFVRWRVEDHYLPYATYAQQYHRPERIRAALQTQ